MTRLEERLRTDLPALADAMLREPANRSSEAIESPVVADRPESSSGLKVSRRAILVGAGLAAGTVAVFAADFFWPSQKATQLEAVGSTAPESFGSWAPMSKAPIEPRPYAIAAWTGSRVVFWAGSSLSRGFAYTDGALYDPATDSWASMPVPGWGHPGLTSVFFDGALYALAKGGGTRFDPITGEWRDLPTVEGMYLAATVATDDGIWGLGPAGLNPAGQPDLAMARYLPDDDTWVYGPTWAGTDNQAEIITGLSRLESTALWTGTEIAVCGRTGGCMGFDPTTENWRSIPATDAEVPAVAVATDLGLVMVVQTTADDSVASIELLTAQGWQRQATGIPIERFDTVTAAAGDEWLMIFAAGQPPIVVHLPSGAWHVVSDGPIGGVQGPNVVWTGDQLVVWGGVPDDAAASSGAVWTPGTT